MVSDVTLTSVESQGTIIRREDAFSSKQWLEYFRENRKNRVSIPFPEDVTVASELKEPLIRSLQRFQIGETGEGKHLRKYASTLKDADYEECIDLFIKEEQGHARVLADMIGALNGTLLQWHWTDMIFVTLRRMLGLKTEIFILLIAEIVGKIFYLQCARKIEDKRMSDSFSLIVVDEIAHLQFHCVFLRTHLARLSKPFRYFVFAAWGVLFYAACLVFVLDHGQTLAGMRVQKRQFLSDCTKEFSRAAAIALDV